MATLKYKVVPKGAANNKIPLNQIFIDKKDVDKVGLGFKEACDIVAKDFFEAASIDVVDMDAVTVSSDGIMVDCAVVAFASADHGKINPDMGFIKVSERPYSDDLIAEEPHMKQWNINYSGRRLYRGPTVEDKYPRTKFNENQTITGRIANNNTGSEVMNVVDMTEVLTPVYGLIGIMKDGEVLVGNCGPEFSVGIGMIVRERCGRIFNWSYGAGKTAHASGVYAKGIKSDYPCIAGPKKVLMEYDLKALECGMVPGRDISSSPALLSIARAGGFPIAFDNIEPKAWVELESVGITREWLETPCKKLSHDELIAKADEIVPGIEEGKVYKATDITEVRYAEIK